MNKDIEQALVKFRENSGRYDKPERYYNGQHDLSFATEKFQNKFGVLPQGVCVEFVPGNQERHGFT